MGARIIFSGTVPCVSFGSALYVPTKKEKGNFRRILLGGQIKRPLGVTVAPVGQAHDFLFIKEVLIRWAREACWEQGLSRGCPYPA